MRTEQPSFPKGLARFVLITALSAATLSEHDVVRARPSGVKAPVRRVHVLETRKQPSTASQCEWHATTAETTPYASWLTAADAGGFAIEVKAQ